MKEDNKERRDLLDGHSYLTMSARMSAKVIAEIAGIKEAEGLRLIELAKHHDK